MSPARHCHLSLGLLTEGVPEPGIPPDVAHGHRDARAPGVVYTLSAGLVPRPAGPAWSLRSDAPSASSRTWRRRSPGLAAFLHASPLAFQFLKYLGVAYLLYMAWATLQAKDPLSVETETATPVPPDRCRLRHPDRPPQPEAPIFFVAFLPQFVARREPGHSYGCWR